MMAATTARAAQRPATSTPLPRQLDQRDADRLRRYREYLDYHEGRRGGLRRPTRPGDRTLVFNYARSIVEKGAAYLVTEHGSEVSAAPGVDAAMLADAERLLREAWEANDLARLDAETEIEHTIQIAHLRVKRYRCAHGEEHPCRNLPPHQRGPRWYPDSHGATARRL